MSTPIVCPACRAEIAPSSGSPQRTRIFCPACQAEFDTAMESGGAATLTLDAPALPREGAKTWSLVAAETDALLYAASSTTDSPRHRVGRFEIRRELGEGAFGKVYEAYDPQLDRVVALKVAKLDRGDAEQRVKRFLREAKSAAGLRHPHIVPLYEFGREGDLFYLVSAYIAGQTLQANLAGQAAGAPKLELLAAGEIMRRLAEALAYAHGQGIVHRDVKPGNVMLDEKGEPILLDFGLASRQEDAEQLTHDGQILGTPLYMAPEQAKGRDGKSVPESDQYALGVMLYELISGTTPFQGTPELVMFHHLETEAPSPRLKNPAVPRDLETICLKCLEKDPARRYASCQVLADDLRRWHEGEPISARRVALVERISRWCRKHPLSAALMGAVAATLVLGVVVSSTFAWQSELNARQARLNESTASENAEKEKTARLAAQTAESQAREAETQAKESAEKERQAAIKEREAARQEQLARRQAEKVGLYLRDLFAANDPQGLGLLGLRSLQEKGQLLTARELLDRGAKQVTSQLKDEPLTQAALMDTIGEVYRALGLFDAAQPLLEQALQLRRKELPAQHPDLAETLTHLGSWHLDKGLFIQAEDFYREALAIRERQGAAGELPASDLLLRWALTKTFLEDSQAADMAKRALDLRVKQYGENHRDVAIAKAVWAAILIDSGNATKAAGPSLEAVQFLLQEGSVDKEKGLRAATEFQQAILFRGLGNYAWAERAFRNSVNLFQEQLGKDHLYAAIPLHELGSSLAKQGKMAEAEAAWLECLAVVRKTTGLEHPRVVLLIESLSEVYGKSRPEEGRKLWKETLAAQERRYGTDYPWRLRTLMKYGQYLAETGSVPEAENIARDVMKVLKERPRKLRLNEGISLQNMGMALGDEGDLDLVREIYYYVIAWEKEAAESGVERNAFAAFSNFGDILVCRSQFMEAEPHLLSAVKLFKASSLFGLRSIDTTLVPYNLARVAWAKGDFEAAEAMFLQTVQQIEDRREEGENSAAACLVALRLQRERYSQALAVLPILHKTRAGKPVDLASYGHLETMLHLLAGDRPAALASLDRALKRLPERSNYESYAYYLRSRVAVEDAAAAVSDVLAAAVSILAIQPKAFSALYVKSLCHLRLKQPAEALAALANMEEPPRPLLHLRDLIVAQAGLQDETKPDRQQQFDDALKRAELACLAQRENKNPLEPRYQIWYWLDLRWLIEQGKPLASK